MATNAEAAMADADVKIEKEANDTVAKATCEMCDDADAAAAMFKCKECDQLACEPCARSHARIKATRSHTLTPLKSSTPVSSRPPTRENYCQVHEGEKLRFYCGKCREVICRDCKLTAHEGHSTVDLSQKAPAAKVLLQDILPILRDSLKPQLQKILEDARTHKTEVKKQKQEIASSLRQRAELIKKEVDDCLEKAEKELFMEFGDVELCVDQSVSEMTKELTTLNDLAERAEQVLQNGCDAALLQLPKQVGDLVFSRQGVISPVNSTRTGPFFGTPVTTSSYGFFSPPVTSSGGLFGTLAQPPSYGKLGVFTADTWRTGLRLAEKSVAGMQHPRLFGTAYRSEGSASTQPFKVPDSLKSEISRSFGTVQKVFPGQSEIRMHSAFVQRNVPTMPGKRTEQNVDSVEKATNLITDLQQRLQKWG